MSRPFPPLQRYLGWLQRFLFQAEVGSFPFPQPTVGIDYDWPLPLQPIGFTYTSAVGNTQTTIIASDIEKHYLIDILCMQGAAVFPITDIFQLTLSQPAGEDIPLIRYAGTDVAALTLPLIGTSLKSNGSGAQLVGIPPIYLPPQSILRVNHASVAGGVVTKIIGRRLELPKFSPLRLP